MPRHLSLFRTTRKAPNEVPRPLRLTGLPASCNDVSWCDPRHSPQIQERGPPTRIFADVVGRDILAGDVIGAVRYVVVRDLSIAGVRVVVLVWVKRTWRCQAQCGRGRGRTALSTSPRRAVLARRARREIARHVGQDLDPVAEAARRRSGWAGPPPIHAVVEFGDD